jgi:glycerol uptake facilitator protein
MMQNIKYNFSRYMAELIGTMILILFGCGVVAMVTIFSSADNPFIVNGGYTNVVLGWGFGVMLGIYATGNISGAHLNPAVTIAMYITKRIEAKHVIPYIIFQLIGAFIGAMLVFLVYYSKWIEFDVNLEYTTGIFATFPAVNNFVSGFFDQVVGTFLLLYLILAITDTNDNNPKQFTPVVIGFLVMAIGISFGGMHGYAINPARDFAPRLFALLVGFKNTGFSDFSIWIVPIIGPILGGILGAVAYDVTIGRVLKNNKK